MARIDGDTVLHGLCVHLFGGTPSKTVRSSDCLVRGSAPSDDLTVWIVSRQTEQVR